MEKKELIREVEIWKGTVKDVLGKALIFEQISPTCKSLLEASLLTLQEILNGKTIREQFEEAIRKEIKKGGKA